MRLAVRIALALVLCVALVGMGVHYAESYEDRWPYASEDELAESYTDHLGEDVLLFGVVTDINTESQELTFVVETEDGTELTFVSDHVPIDDGAPAVESGGFVQVYGEVGADNQIATENTVVVNPTGTAELYKLSVSALGLLGAMAYFLYYWRPTRTGWEVS